MAKKKSIHYVDNKEFLRAMIEWREEYDLAEKNEIQTPPVTNYIGECFLKIATHLSYKPNFISKLNKDKKKYDTWKN